MKRYKITIPEREAVKLADYAYENGFVTLLSWRTEAGMFDPAMVTAIYAVPDAKEAAFATDYRKFIQN